MCVGWCLKTWDVLCVHALIVSLVPLVSLEVDRGVVLRYAVGHLAVTRATHLEAYPPVAEEFKTQSTPTAGELAERALN